MQRVNLPPQVRAALYVVTALLSPVVGVLVMQHVLPNWVATLWSGEVAAVGTLAALNVSNSQDK